MESEFMIAADFWQYVERQREITLLGVGGPALIGEGELACGHRYAITVEHEPNEPQRPPTLQGMLFDYLRDNATGPLIGSSYELWQKAVACIRSDVEADPDRLAVPILKPTGSSSVEVIQDTMVIEDDWYVLDRNAFNLILSRASG